MRCLRTAIAALMITSSAPAFAESGIPVYGYAPAVPLGLPYAEAYVPGPPNLWRQRREAYDAIFTKEKRVIYDADYVAEFKQTADYYAPPQPGFYAPNGGVSVYYWRRPTQFGPVRSHAPAPPVVFFGPPAPPNCGTFRYWDGTRCLDARFQSRYQNPFKYIFSLN